LHPVLVNAELMHPVLVRQNQGILGDVVRLELVGKAKRDRVAIDARSAGRNLVEFEEDVFAELEPARRSA
jgi:hypothetical protein